MKTLFPLLMRLAQVQSEAVDRLALQSCVEQIDKSAQIAAIAPREVIAHLVTALQLPKPRWLRASSVDPASCPCLIHREGRGWALLRGRTAQNEWLTETFDLETNRWVETPLHGLQDWTLVKLKLARPYDTAGSEVYKLIQRELFSHKMVWVEGAVAGLMINLIALAT